jgi:hypothetical protein
MTNPRKKNPAAGLFAVLLLLVIAAAVVVLVWSPQREAPAERPTPDPAVTGWTAPTSAPEIPPTAETTPASTPTATSTPSPEPTPDPTPESTPTPDIQASGSFRSATGLGLELIAAWYVVPAATGTADVNLTLYVESYSLSCADIWNGAALDIGGRTYAFSTGAVINEGPDMAQNELGSVTVNVPLDSDGSLNLPAEVRWHFDGAYGGEELEIVTASGTISA